MFRSIFVLAFLLVESVRSLSSILQDAKIYEKGDPVLLKVNRMTSMKTQISMDYYQLPFCQPHNGPVMDDPSLGEFLTGERTKTSPYVLKMKEDMSCEQLCIANLDSTVNKAIHNQYYNKWRVDNFPSASIIDDKGLSLCYWGFPIGYTSDDTGIPYIYNHVNIEIMYRPVGRDEDKYQIVRFTVHPYSIHHDFQELDEDEVDIFSSKVAKIRNPIGSCEDKSKVYSSSTSYDTALHRKREPQIAAGNVLFTYDVNWIDARDYDWNTQVDMYLSIDNIMPDNVDWIPIFSSFSFIMVLSGILVAILVKYLRHHNEVIPDKEKGMEEIEELGSNTICNSPFLYSIFCGTGAQILCSSLMTIVCCFMGIVDPKQHGSILTAFLLLYAAFGVFGGYVTARFYKSFQGESPNQVIVCAALGFPGIVFFFFFLIQIMLMENDHSYPEFMNVMVFLLCLLLGVNTPFVILGSQFGYRQDSFEFVGQTPSIHRDISHQPWFLRIPVINVVGGCILFGTFTTFVPSIRFGILPVVYLILVVVCADVNILVTFLHIRCGNHHWLWQPFYTAGSVALFIFLSIMSIMWDPRGPTGFYAQFLFLGWVGISCFAIFLIMGFIGVYASIVIRNLVYASINSN